MPDIITLGPLFLVWKFIHGDIKQKVKLLSTQLFIYSKDTELDEKFPTGLDISVSSSNYRNDAEHRIYVPIKRIG